MRRLRVTIGLVLATVLVLAMGVPASAAGFTDIDDNPFEASINALACRAFVGGYDDGTFKPDNLLQRQQFAKMAVLTMGYEVSTADVSPFTDTAATYDPVNNPLYPGSFAAVAAEQGIIKGYPSGAFGFSDNLTRQQAITIVVRAAGAALADAPEDYQGVLTYSDPNHGDNLKKAEYNGLLEAIPDLAAWDTTGYATRGEAAELLAQLYYRTGVVLTLTGPSGVQEFTMAELKTMEATTGYGGWKNKLGNITGPWQYTGVAVGALVDLAGGGDEITVIASDGYSKTYSADELAGKVDVFDPATGEKITDFSDQVTLVLTYETAGKPLPSDDGALRAGYLSPNSNQVTDSKLWPSEVVAIAVSPSIDPVVSTDWLAENLEMQGLVIVDIRSAEAYATGHIPHSISIPAGFYTNTAPEDMAPGRLYMEVPAQEDLFKLLGDSGITSSSKVVVVGGYDPMPTYGLADMNRVADTLIYAGVRNVAVLDGAYPKWVADGKPVTTDVPTVTPVTYTGTVAAGMFVSTEYVKNHIGTTLIIDARDATVYSGETTEPWATKPGHIPTAVSLPAPLIWAEDWTYKPAEALADPVSEVMDRGVCGEIIVYCGVGGYESSWWYVLTQMLNYNNVKLYDGAAQAWAVENEMVTSQ